MGILETEACYVRQRGNGRVALASLLDDATLQVSTPHSARRESGVVDSLHNRVTLSEEVDGAGDVFLLEVVREVVP